MKWEESDMEWCARIIKGIHDMTILGTPFKEWPIELQNASMWAYLHHEE